MRVTITTTKLDCGYDGYYAEWIERFAEHRAALARAGFAFAEMEEVPLGAGGVLFKQRIVGPIERDLTIEQLVALARDVGEIIVRRDGVLEVYDDHRE